jgi:ABC-type transporter Mla maintaining outer membrane lipid asymmetry permease subunit MlaE
METSRHSSPIVLVAALVAGSVFLMWHSGFFEGAFRTDILTSVKAEDVLIAADAAAMGKVTFDNQHTGSVR